MRLVYVSNFNSSGVPDLLNVKLPNILDIGQSNINIKKNISNAVLNEVNTKLPERKFLFNSHPEWIKDNTLILLDQCQIKVTFIDEGAGYQNGFGYYFYETVNPPSKVSDIEDVYIIFPNASKLGGGGYLQAGDTMQLAYEFNTLTVGNLIIGTPTNYTFPENISIGFVIFANGWKSSTQNVNKNAKRYFTDSRFNPERAEWLKRHTSLVKLNTEPLLVMGIEDLPRDKSYCDHDFNDLVVIIELDDIDSLSEESYGKDSENINNPPTEFKVGYKKAFANVQENSEDKITEVIITLYIPLTSTVIKHRFSNKIRTNKAYVASILGMDHQYIKWNTATENYIGHSFTTAHPSNDDTFIYTDNDWVEIIDLDTNPDTHGSGIYYFASYNEAHDYDFD